MRPSVEAEPTTAPNSPAPASDAGPRFSFVFDRYGREERQTDYGVVSRLDTATRTTVTVIASNEAEAREKIETLSGKYDGPGHSIFRRGGTYDLSGWGLVLLTVTEVS